VSASDAYDAMTHTRQYREGLGSERAISILSELSGEQWDPRAVKAVIAAVPDLGDSPAFESVGSAHPAEHGSCAEDWVT